MVALINLLSKKLLGLKIHIQKSFCGEDKDGLTGDGDISSPTPFYVSYHFNASLFNCFPSILARGGSSNRPGCPSL